MINHIAYSLILPYNWMRPEKDASTSLYQSTSYHVLNRSNVLQDRFIIPPPTPPKNKYSQQYLLLTPPNNSSPLPFSIAPLYESTINKTKQIIITQLNDLPQSTKQQLIFLFGPPVVRSLFMITIYDLYSYISLIMFLFLTRLLFLPTCLLFLFHGPSQMMMANPQI